MTQMTRTQSFINDLKAAGITITNEHKLIKAMDSDVNAEKVFERICLQGRVYSVSFTANPNTSATSLTQAFKNAGFDGFTYRSFLSNLQLDSSLPAESRTPSKEPQKAMTAPSV